MAVDNNNNKKYFIKGIQAPNLATIKDFIYFYIKTLKRQISHNPIQLSVLNFIKDFLVTLRTLLILILIYRIGMIFFI